MTDDEVEALLVEIDAEATRSRAIHSDTSAGLLLI